MDNFLKPSRPFTSDKRVPLRRDESTETTRSSYASTPPASGTSEWEEEEGVYRPIEQTKTKNEPMSPVVVVLYVVAFYLVYQILTRPDDVDLFSNSTTTIPQSHTPPPMDIPRYHHPYQLPHIPSPTMPLDNPSEAPWWRVILRFMVYPINLAVALIATILPLSLNALSLLIKLVSTLLWPFTSLAQLLFRTFVTYPWNICMRVLDLFYPVFVFVGGTLGVGCLIGGMAGWIGSVCISRYIEWKEGDRKRAKTRRRKTRPASWKVHLRRDSSESSKAKSHSLQVKPSDNLAPRHHRKPSLSGSSTERPQSPDEILHDPISLLSERSKIKRADWGEKGLGTARERVIVGIRKRRRDL
ncbi:hypothetical protein CNBC2760 [Cryptococcus gattii WM276]|uniref:Uncharacterized protein n=1 Tax=Cryptococcus gattii serotype B (strain WM276 / ATCC MYA-4071) TaxID=367775 RepID=E6R1S9_CRYGW|nr:uncharacterized protein CGB_C6520C [Cryptococcus gattii WM276]ADV21178.1 hypothetical protein CNBC2760 [Cryptococcus gattii WM276]